MDIATAVAHFEDLGLEALAAAHLAGHEDVCEEQHLHLELTGALALLAATARHVEGEVAGSELATFGIRQLREDATDL